MLSWPNQKHALERELTDNKYSRNFESRSVSTLRGYEKEPRKARYEPSSASRLSVRISFATTCYADLQAQKLNARKTRILILSDNLSSCKQRIAIFLQANIASPKA
jgi:hypothetical protein